MDEPTLRQLLDDVRAGSLSPDDAVARLRRLPFADLGYARVDHHRTLRQGLPEAVYGAGKDARAVRRDRGRAAARSPAAGPSSLTRADPEQAAAALARNPGAIADGPTLVWRPAARAPARVLVRHRGHRRPARRRRVRRHPRRLRLPAPAPHRRRGGGRAPAARVGRRARRGRRDRGDRGHGGRAGQLVGGLTPAPVVAVPTSVGYGAALEGVTALLAMLASCAAGVTVVGIDNGYGAACAVAADPPMTAGTTAWFHCFSGIAGDMALGALIDAGADLDEVRALLRRVPVGGWKIDAQPVLRGGIGGDAPRGAHGRVAGGADRTRTSPGSSTRRACPSGCARPRPGHVPRPGPRRGAPAPPPARAGALPRGRRARRHRRHRRHLRRARECSTSTTSCASAGRHRHGDGAQRARLLPNPAPAVVELLRGAPTYGRRHRLSSSPPRRAPRSSPPTRRRLRADAGHDHRGDRLRRRHARPRRPSQHDPGRARHGGGRPARPGQPVALLEVNVDDATGETLAHTVAALLEAGAHDAWVTPIVMKKGRPAYTVSALADPALADQVSEVLVARDGLVRRAGPDASSAGPAARSSHEVEVAGLPVRVKVSAGRVKVEHDDAARVAASRRSAAARGRVAGRGGVAAATARDARPRRGGLGAARRGSRRCAAESRRGPHPATGAAWRSVAGRPCPPLDASAPSGRRRPATRARGRERPRARSPTAGRTGGSRRPRPGDPDETPPRRRP